MPRPDSTLPIACISPAIKYFTPQRIVAPDGFRQGQQPCLQIRFVGARRGNLLLSGGDRVLVRRRVNAHREQRILLPLPSAAELTGSGSLTLDFEPA